MAGPEGWWAGARCHGCGPFPRRHKCQAPSSPLLPTPQPHRFQHLGDEQRGGRAAQPADAGGTAGGGIRECGPACLPAGKGALPQNMGLPFCVSVTPVRCASSAVCSTLLPRHPTHAAAAALPAQCSATRRRGATAGGAIRRRRARGRLRASQPSLGKVGPLQCRRVCAATCSGPRSVRAVLPQARLPQLGLDSALPARTGSPQRCCRASPDCCFTAFPGCLQRAAREWSGGVCGGAGCRWRGRRHHGAPCCACYACCACCKLCRHRCRCCWCCCRCARVL